MKKGAERILLDNLADISSKTPQIRNYVLIYQDRKGDITCFRSGSSVSQLGMVEAVKGFVKNEITKNYTNTND